MNNRIELLRAYINKIIKEIPDKEYQRGAYSHLYSVSQFAALIAVKRGENAELATMAGLLHDLYTFKHMNSEKHAKRGALLAREILGELQITNAEETDMICSSIHNHSKKSKTHSPFDEVIVDADVLSHSLYNITLPPFDKDKERFQKLIIELGLDNSILSMID